MSRRRKAIKREVMPDPKFNDKIVSKFTSCLMFEAVDLLPSNIKHDVNFDTILSLNFGSGITSLFIAFLRLDI
jgi:small subunit ribosomal protein S7